MILTFFHFLIECVGFPAAPSICLLLGVYLSTRTQEVFLSLSLWSSYFHSSSWMSCCELMHLTCALRCVDVNWCERQQNNKGFFLVFMVVKCSSSQSWHKPAQAGGKLITSCLSAPFLSAVLQKHLKGAQMWLRWIQLVCVSLWRWTSSAPPKNEMHFCVASNLSASSASIHTSVLRLIIIVFFAISVFSNHYLGASKRQRRWGAPHSHQGPQCRIRDK